MQINRLFEIVYILLNKKKVTAKYLSEHFEVSVRTIYRDVEALGTAGIPVFMAKGKGGGISLLDSFVLNKSLLTDDDQNEILAALQGLNSIKYPNIDNVISKLGMLFNKTDCNWIDVDFSQWGNADREKFSLLKTAVINKNILIFEYYSSYGEKTHREVEPLQLCFKDKAWYLRAFCLTKSAYRLFKLTRMKKVEISGRRFERELPDFVDSKAKKDESIKTVIFKLHVDKSLAYRVYDEFDENNIIKNVDGSFEVAASYPEDEWVYGYILSYGSFAKVMEPAYLRDIIAERLKQALRQY